MNRHVLAAAALSAIVWLPGCAGFSEYFWNDLPPSYQKEQVRRYDPFPYPDIAPPVEGGRPRDFDVPRAEPVRARWNTTPPPPLAPLILPAPVPAAPSYTAPPPPFVP